MPLSFNIQCVSMATIHCIQVKYSVIYSFTCCHMKSLNVEPDEYKVDVNICIFIWWSSKKKRHSSVNSFDWPIMMNRKNAGLSIMTYNIFFPVLIIRLFYLLLLSPLTIRNYCINAFDKTVASLDKAMKYGHRNASANNKRHNIRELSEIRIYELCIKRSFVFTFFCIFLFDSFFSQKIIWMKRSWCYFHRIGNAQF